jgi:hypothetical protein
VRRRSFAATVIGKGPINFLMVVHKDNLWSAAAKPLRGAAAVIDN